MPTTTRYLEILALQTPFTYGLDENQRTVFACNYRATAAYPVDRFEEDVYQLLYTANVIGGLGVTTFIGPAAVIPSSNTAPYFVHLNRTSGYSPLETHNGDKYERLSIQITVHSSSYITARDKAVAIWRVMDGQRDVSITS